MENFLKAQKRSWAERKLAMSARWPDWEFKKEGEEIVFLNFTQMGLLTERIVIGREYDSIDGQKNQWKVNASWSPTETGGCLLQERAGGPIFRGASRRRGPLTETRLRADPRRHRLGSELRPRVSGPPPRRVGSLPPGRGAAPRGRPCPPRARAGPAGLLGSSPAGLAWLAGAVFALLSSLAFAGLLLLLRLLLFAVGLLLGSLSLCLSPPFVNGHPLGAPAWRPAQLDAAWPGDRRMSFFFRVCRPCRSSTQRLEAGRAPREELRLERPVLTRRAEACAAGWARAGGAPMCAPRWLRQAIARCAYVLQLAHPVHAGGARARHGSRGPLSDMY
ncbi:unnamed protein product [Prorocentrum cordatum]|uniref:Uncharacterized protein n=1 Tax=Prorocentrum cordatum TaxID=2364126 RepID=A0ABN9TLN9_9DINO|nr:unnamed protein product [Polarella glacialis]